MELIQISAGRGPIECSWAVPRVAKELMKDAEKSGFKTDVVFENEDYERETFKSIVISISGAGSAGLIDSWTGSVQWIAQSKFRPHHKRKNWFVSVKPLLKSKEIDFKESDIRFETMRAGGAGGQHVNKTESAVRATHLPSGMSVTITNRRSQHRNKSIAIALLAEKIEEQNAGKAQVTQKYNWQNHNELIRGNPVRVFRS